MRLGLAVQLWFATVLCEASVVKSTVEPGHNRPANASVFERSAMLGKTNGP